MDTRLFESAQAGNINFLHHLLAENPLILHTVSLTSEDNPLHIASTAGHADFVREIIRLKPSFSVEVNQDGFSSLHLASAVGHLEIVRELLKFDPKLCRLEGRNRWTPLHYAASKGRVDIIREMLLGCPESIQDVNVQKETALHLAVKNSQFEAIHFMVEWIRNMKMDEIFNMKDELGNSILHLATWRKHRQYHGPTLPLSSVILLDKLFSGLFLKKEFSQIVEWMLGNIGTNEASGKMEVNAINQSGLTALDVLLIFTSEAGDREIEHILRNAGAKRARDIALPAQPPFESDNQAPVHTSTATSDSCADDLVEYFKFKRGRDSPSDARTALLVIAVLAAAATFQAGLNPPGGVWQDTNSNGTATEPAHEAGMSILGSYNSAAYLIFMVFNTIGFSVAIYVISILISNFPFRWEFEVCIVALFGTYNTAITFMAPKNMKVFLTVFTLALPGVIKLLAKLVRQLIKTIRGLLQI